MQKTYSQRYAFGYPGLLDGIGPNQVRAFVNSALDAANQWTIAIPATVDNTAEYSVALSGGELAVGQTIAASFTTDGSATQAELGSGLLAAIQASDIMQYFNAVLANNTITLEALKSGVGFTVAAPSNASTTNDLTVTQATAAASSTPIPMGRFVVQVTASDASNEARLPASNTGVRLLGVTGLSRDQERDAIGETAKYEYQPNQAMDVVHKTANGVWVECDSPDIKVSTAVFIDCTTAGKLGRITTVSTNNLALPVTAGLVDSATLDPNGTPIVLVGLTMP